MDIFDVLSLIGGLCLFMFGMNIMGENLERSVGGKLELFLSKLTTGKIAGLLTGLAVTGVIQSSSATTVMVVGFVNSGLMSLSQAINVIMGANIGTTVTAWILSLAGIGEGALFLKLLKPSSFSPILALIGLVLYMFSKSSRHKSIGCILLGFSTLMTGMEIMSSSVSHLAEVPEFKEILLLFENPIFGVLAGAVLTAIIQSSSASVGILQALSSTGQITIGASVPIIMGQNIGTCVTALLSSFGTNKNAKRAALVHLSFNIIGTVVWLTVFYLISVVFSPAILSDNASYASIAVIHSLFNVLCTCMLLPLSGLLEKLSYKLIPKSDKPVRIAELDERLLQTPAIALERSRAYTRKMAASAINSLSDAISCLFEYSDAKSESIRKAEDYTDKCEEEIGDYLVKLSAIASGGEYANDAAFMLRVIGDFERIGDHAVNLLESAEEIRNKKLKFTSDAEAELLNICAATNEILSLSLNAFTSDDLSYAQSIEPLEEIIDLLKEKCRTSHIQRLQKGECTIEAGFVWSDILTNLERTSDHCSNIALSLLDVSANTFHGHEKLNAEVSDRDLFKKNYERFASRYLA